MNRGFSSGTTITRISISTSGREWSIKIIKLLTKVTKILPSSFGKKVSKKNQSFTKQIKFATQIALILLAIDLTLSSKDAQLHNSSRQLLAKEATLEIQPQNSSISKD